ncbi:hypothetical protein ES703_40361 [subsurface metagenome]
MYKELKELRKQNKPIKVAVVGAGGSMGKGICLQTKLTPGLKLVAAIDINTDGAEEAAKSSGHPGVLINSELFPILDKIKIDVLVEATNTVEFAAKACIAALERKIHVVLMNAEVDLLLRPYLQKIAKENGVVITSDAGDQHGVVARMANEIQAWGFDLVMLGNIKGFLNRYATILGMQKEAAKRYLNVIQCVAYTDGTKLNFEQSLLANGFGMLPWKRGMLGPKCDDITEIFDKLIFDYTILEGMRRGGTVDYVLGAQPGGGVFVIGYCEDKLQQRYLEYYKRGEGPYYLFYRPYHLCHLETPRAIANAFLYHKAFLEPQGKLTDVFAFAKKDLYKGLVMGHGIGSSEFYGMIDSCENAKDLVPIALLETEDTAKPILERNLNRDEPLLWNDVDFNNSELFSLYQKQEKYLKRRK